MLPLICSNSGKSVKHKLKQAEQAANKAKQAAAHAAAKALVDSKAAATKVAADAQAAAARVAAAAKAAAQKTKAAAEKLAKDTATAAKAAGAGLAHTEKAAEAPIVKAVDGAAAQVAGVANDLAAQTESVTKAISACATQFRQNKDSSAQLGSAFASWMAEPAVGALKLSELTLPGTHDSAAYHLFAEKAQHMPNSMSKYASIANKLGVNPKPLEVAATGSIFRISTASASLPPLPSSPPLPPLLHHFLTTCTPPPPLVCVMPVVCERNGDGVSESVPKQRKGVSDEIVPAVAETLLVPIDAVFWSSRPTSRQFVQKFVHDSSRRPLVMCGKYA